MTRRQLHVKVRNESWERLNRYAALEGVSMAALVDTISHQLGRETNAIDLTQAIVEARILDAERRARG